MKRVEKVDTAGMITLKSVSYRAYKFEVCHLAKITLHDKETDSIPDKGAAARSKIRTRYSKDKPAYEIAIFCCIFLRAAAPLSFGVCLPSAESKRDGDGAFA